MAAAVLEPRAALAYLRELSPGVRSATLFDAAGRVLAGDEPGVPGASGAGVVEAVAGGLTLTARLHPAAAACAAVVALARTDARAALDASDAHAHERERT